jgi:hypothetical protein
MKKNDFNCSIDIEISASQVIKKISDVPDWWGVAFTGSAENQNDTFTVRMGGDSFFNFSVTDLVPDKKIIWLVTDCYMPWYSDKTEWTDTKLIFDLAEENGVTTLTFTHQGLTPNVECYKDCETGWSHWIKTSLFSYLTTGSGRLKTKKKVIYSTSVEVPFPPAVAFANINKVAKWWPEDFDGESAKLNDEFVLSTGNVHISKQKVIEFVADKKVVWLTTESIRKTDNYQWTGTKFIFALSSSGNTTTVTMTYDGAVFENEYDRLVQVCDKVLKEDFYNYITKLPLC